MPAPQRPEPAVSPYRPLLPNLRRDPAPPPESPKSKESKGPILDLPK
jgi:hypothetical protein